MVQDVLRKVDLGLVVAGEGSMPATSVYWFGLHFYPDLAILHYSRPLIAFEVKYLTGSARQSALVSGIGQTTIYRNRYERSALFIADLTQRKSYERESLDSAQIGIEVISRRRNPSGKLDPPCANFAQ